MVVRRVGWLIFVTVSLSFSLFITSLVVTESTANAGTKSSKGWVYRSTSNCTWARADINHGEYGGGGSYAFTRSKRMGYYGFTQFPCSVNYSRPAGYIAVKYYRLKYTSSGWKVCTYTRYSFNPVRRHYHSISGDSGGRRPSCGRGYYRTTGFSYVYNGGWYGGRERSGYHYLPA